MTGSNGFIGKKLRLFFEKKGHQVTGISRFLICGNLQELASSLAESDAVIHLAGAPVMQRWTKKNRRIIYNSRIITTWNLTRAMNQMDADKKPRVFISISAVGIYRSGRSHDEQSINLDPHFLGRVVTDWENASVDLDKRIRRIIFRTGIVLGKESEVIKNLLPLFKMGLGGKIGDGKQPFPFIHTDDLEQAFYEGIVNETYSGIYNLVAPDQVNNEQFTLMLAGKLNKPAFFSIPSFVLKIIYGDAAVMLLKNPEVIPRRLADAAFRFRYPTLSAALDEILKKS